MGANSAFQVGSGAGGRPRSGISCAPPLYGPPTKLLYRASARRNPRARAFIDFVLQLLQQLDEQGQFLAQPPSAERPDWHRRGYGRASATLVRRAWC